MRRILSLLSFVAIVLLASCSDGGGKTANDGSLSQKTGTVGAEGGSIVTGDGSSVAVDPSVLASAAPLTVTVREAAAGELGEGVTAESKVVELSMPYDALSAPSENPEGEAAGIAIDIPMDSLASRSAAVPGDLLMVYITVEVDGTVIGRLAAPAVADESGKTTAFIHNKYLEDQGAITARNAEEATPQVLNIRSVIVNSGEQAAALEAGLGGGKLYRVTGFTGGNAEYFDTGDSVVSYGGKQALILVHGIDAAAGNFGSFWSTDNIPGNLTPYWNDFLEYFYSGNLAEKFDLYGFVYYLGDPLARSGNNLALKIADKLDAYPSAVILSHSVGGLVARSALSDTTGFTSEPDPGVKDEVRGKVSRIITLATPHRGTPLASPEFQTLTRTDGSTSSNWQVAMPANLSELINGTEGGRDLAWDGVMGGAAPADTSANFIYRLNENTGFDSRIVALGSWDLSGSGHGIYNSLHKLMREAGYENDGVVPENSSLFRSTPEQSRALRTWSILDYDHSQMKEGKPDSTALLDEVKEELLAAWKLNEVVTFADPNLEACVREHLENTTEPLTYALLEPLTFLSCDERSIVSLGGIEAFVNLNTLYLWRNQISDLSPLSGLTNLTGIGLGNNLISDVSPLSGLTKLTTLGLFYNQISDISPLSDMTDLTYLELWHNQIIDVSPLSSMTNLTRLGISENKVVDIASVTGMTELTFLDLGDNQIVDISPLADKTKLTFLVLFKNQIGDFSPVSNLTGLKYLYLSMNNSSDISPISGLTNLEHLVITALNLNDISPVAGLTKLKVLHFYHNQISDISPLAGLTNLTELNFYGNVVSDISPLSGLTNLKVLSLNFNRVADISALSGMTAMSSLSLAGNYISDTSPLVGMAGLATLYLNSNRLSDVTPLSSLKSLVNLNLSSNCIADISPVSFVPNLDWEPQFLSCGPSGSALSSVALIDFDQETELQMLERLLSEARAQYGDDRLNRH
ncbi:hypothetical protein EPN96_02420 [bacterium]|nr:MAG: hypothetical protein EPN96_02420 [bacterium]